MKQIRFSTIVPYIICATCTSVAIVTLSTSHPLVSALIITLGVGFSLLALLIWGWLHLHSCKRLIGKVRWTMLRYSTSLIHRREMRKHVSIDQIKQLLTNVKRLQAVFYNALSEVEQPDNVDINHCRRYTNLMTRTPDSATLYAEFESLMKVLAYLGVQSSSLKNVRLQQKDLVFLQQWGQDLETRLLRQQRHTFEQWKTLRSILKALVQQHQVFGQAHSPIPQVIEYYRIQEVLHFLTNMVNDPRCPLDLAQHSVRKIQHDVHILVVRPRLIKA